MFNKPDLLRLSGNVTIRAEELIGLIDDAEDYIDELETIIAESDSPSEVHDARLLLADWKDRYGDTIEELRNVVNTTGGNGYLIRDDGIENHIASEVYECYPELQNLPSFVSVEIDFDLLKQDYMRLKFQDHVYWWRE